MILNSYGKRSSKISVFHLIKSGVCVCIMHILDDKETLFFEIHKFIFQSFDACRESSDVFKEFKGFYLNQKKYPSHEKLTELDVLKWLRRMGEFKDGKMVM